MIEDQSVIIRRLAEAAARAKRVQDEISTARAVEQANEPNVSPRSIGVTAGPPVTGKK